jgi:hypothetical protein
MEEQLPQPGSPTAPPPKKRAGRKKIPGIDQEHGLEMLLKINLGQSQQLSQMADNKAQILITVDSIILSAVISFLIRKLDNSPYLIIPTIILLFTTLSSMIFAILATRPDVSRGTFRHRDLDLKNVNLLFFGNFYKMRMETYAEGLMTMLSDKEFLYKSLIKDIYKQGVVLGRKYFLLRLGYNFFMFGTIAVILAFIVALTLHYSASLKH